MSKSKPKYPAGYIEKIQRQITRDLKDKNFSSMEEANKYIQENYLGKNVDIPDAVLSKKEQAMNLIYDAWESESNKEKIALAEKALMLDEDCADAYNLLADVKAGSDMEALELFAKGIEAGKKSIGSDFENLKGSFWGFHETRPYMRAMAGYSYFLWELGERSKSVEIMKEMLQLNPNDNQGIRHILITKLLILKKYVEAMKLYKEYEDDSTAQWYYSKAYLYFNQRSKQLYADNTLKDAMEYNPYVPLYLLGVIDMPDELPDYVGFGDEEEAVVYVHESMEIWAKNKKTLMWFVKMFKKMHEHLDSLIEEREKEKEKREKSFNSRGRHI